MPNESIIEELYNRMVQENPTSQEYDKQRRKNIELREKLEESLTEQQKEELNILIENRIITDSIISNEMFIKGFKIAVKIIIEALSKDNT